MEGMEKVSENNYRNYIPWAKANSANTVYPCSIAEGFQSGDIYVCDDAGLRSVFFWHYCGFAFLSGSPDNAFMDYIADRLLHPAPERRFVLISDDPAICSRLSAPDGLTRSDRIYYRAVQAPPEFALPDGMALCRITPELLPLIRGRIVPAWSWESPEQFLKEGFGYAAFDQGRVCAVSFSAAVSSDEIDIGVETQEDYRKMGLASLLAGRMCDRIVEIGKKPVWAHSISNKGSMNTALKCGFVQSRVNTVIRKS